MDALLASAGPLPQRKAHRSSTTQRSRKPLTAHKTVNRGPEKESIDPSTHSILSSTRLPSSFHDAPFASSSSTPFLPSRQNGTASSSSVKDRMTYIPNPLRPDPSVSRIRDKKLRAKVSRVDVASQKARVEREEVDEWLNGAFSGGQGGIEVDEEEGERTWRVGQEEIVKSVGEGSGRKRFDLKFDNLGDYMADYTRNGRHLVIASTRGHVATFDWQAGRLNSEIQLKETVRDIKFLHSEAFFAVAQKKYVFIYDMDGVELHKLKQHLEPTHMEYLPYHYLLSTVSHTGHLRYHDTSTGILLTQIPTRLGSPPSMASNPHSGIVHLGHTNGTMTLWSPNMTIPHVKLLAHRGPVSDIAVDPSESSAGRYCVTGGMDGLVKLWDGRMWGREVRSWGVRNRPETVSFSGRGMLAVGTKGGVAVYRDLYSNDSTSSIKSNSLPSTKIPAPTPYLSLPTPALSPKSTVFCPYEDLLAVGHSKGVSSMLVPGSGEANFDSAEADVYESRTRRREREVRGVLEKIRPELITLDTEFLGKVGETDKGTYEEREGRSYRQLGRMERLGLDGQAEEADGSDDGAEGAGDERRKETVERRKHKARGKGGSMKKYLKKKRKNVIDPTLLAMRAKVAKQRGEDDQKRRKETGELPSETGALARFG